jgi:predicted MFS family arabinose efflux permease
MSPAQRFRAGCYTLEGLNSFAVVIYFNYLYFYFRDWYGFDNQRNLELAAFIGLVYTFASWQAGRFAARFGYFTALKCGYGIMAVGLLAGSQIHSVGFAVAVACLINVGMCMIWPTLEALVSEGAEAANAVGLYNITWAATNALAYFIGGTLIEKFGYKCIFYVPFVIMLVQFELAYELQKYRPKVAAGATHAATHAPDPRRPSPERAKSFQRMAWLANPFAYIAINTLLAVMPGVAARFHLSPMLAGFACSLWCFVRLGMFVVLWFWTAWHYRFAGLMAAYALLMVSFATILMTTELGILIAAQVVFGAAIGLIYYSSLFYAMDASDSNSEHGGIHEAAIGVGNCVGPAVGAASLQFLPQMQNSGAAAVTVLLLCGFAGLFAVRRYRPKTKS